MEIRFEPFYGDLEREIDRYIDHFQRQKRPMVQFGPRKWHPLVDVFETHDMVVACVELAGIDREQLDVVVEPKTLTVRGARGEVSGLQPTSYHLLEIHHGPFERVIGLPATVAPEDASAETRNGMLVIRMPKQATQQINISVSAGDAAHGS